MTEHPESWTGLAPLSGGEVTAEDAEGKKLTADSPPLAMILNFINR